jgi:hypothetical protein
MQKHNINKKIIEYDNCREKNNKDIDFMQEQLNKLNKKVHCGDIINTVDKSVRDDIDFIQIQLNNISKKYVEMKQQEYCNEERYKQLVSEIDNIHMLTDCLTKTDCDCKQSDPCICDNKLFYTESNTSHQYMFECDKIIFITMVGGGGAGGIGYVNGMYYFSGSGGGSGSCLLKKPVKVQKGTIINIQVGSGGCSNNDRDGGYSSIEIISPCGNKDKYICAGGKCGNSFIITDQNHTGENIFVLNTNLCVNIENNVDGGKGAIITCNILLSGCDGQDGQVTVPSQFRAVGGTGGNSMFNAGGKGGGNYFNEGGLGGLETDVIGKDGESGSGGGGSAPRLIFPKNTQLSGCGGTGFVLIEF